MLATNMADGGVAFLFQFRPLHTWTLGRSAVSSFLLVHTYMYVYHVCQIDGNLGWYQIENVVFLGTHRELFYVHVEKINKTPQRGRGGFFNEQIQQLPC